MKEALSDMMNSVRKQLEGAGIVVEDYCADEDRPVKVVCIAPGLGKSVREMERQSRDHVVMVRLDQETSETLDAWVVTGAVKSRSEAAALFIREGLQVRAQELDQLKDALDEVNEAKDRLRQQAREILGEDEEDAESAADGEEGTSDEGAEGGAKSKAAEKD